MSAEPNRAEAGSPVGYERRGRVGVITLSRPEVRNAVDKATAELISSALDRLDADDGAAAGVFTGSGGVFSAGMDLKAFSSTGERPLDERRGPFGLAWRASDKPLVAAVEGKALGGGLEMALACDLIVAARDSVFGLPEVKRGLVAAAGGVLRLPESLPARLAKEMALTGEPITARRAHELGMVSRLADPGAVLEAAVELAATIAANAPLATRASKQVIDRAVDWPLDERFERQGPYIDPVRSSEDAKEGARAFVEKRAPEWQGR